MHKFCLILPIAFAMSYVQAADFDADVLPDKLATATKNFLEADTAAARSGMAAFSDEDLQKITNAFKKSHPGSEQRIFWLVEELYRRNAERVAAERIRFLYYAVLAALAIIAGFSALTYRSARRVPTPGPSPLAGRGDETPPPRAGEGRRGTGAAKAKRKNKK